MIRPCVHPRCDDGNGNARLTTQTMCDPCRNRVRTGIDWLAQDFVTLRTTLPRPANIGAQQGGKPTFTAAGHPAQWASDTCRLIAVTLNETEDALRDHLGDDPAIHPHNNEARMIRHATLYLTARIDAVCTFPGARSFADEIGELHHQIRRALGLTRYVQRLPLPCPTCDVVALVRHTAQIECESCGRIIREEDYGLLGRIAADAALDDLIAQYDATHTDELAQ